MNEITNNQKCPKCKSANTNLIEKTITCKDCNYINTNYKYRNEHTDHKILYKNENVRLNKENINSVYNNILSIWIKTINKNHQALPLQVKPMIDKLSQDFEDNLKGFFEITERKLELTKDKS